MKNTALLLVLGFLCSEVAQAQWPSPQLHSVFPPGAQRGSSLEVSLRGTDLDGVKALHFSHPGITAEQVTSDAKPYYSEAQPVPNKFTVSVAGDVPLGQYEVRAIGYFGISTPRVFTVGELPETNEQESNNDFENAMALKVNSLINAKADSRNWDYYQFEAREGDRLLIECAAHRIDSQMDPSLVLFDANGRELRRSRDVKRRDPMIDFTVPSKGVYYLLVHDFLYNGGDDHFYRLSVHTRPHIDYVLPPAGTPGKKTSFTLYGRNLPGGQTVPGQALEGQPLEQMTVQIQVPNNDEPSKRNTLVQPEDSMVDGFEYRLESEAGTSNPVYIGFANAPIQMEQGNNDSRDSPQPISLPGEICGQFHPRADQDWYTFEASQGEKYWIEVISQRQGQPTDPYCILQQVIKNEDGSIKQVRDIQILDDLSNQPGNNLFNLKTDDPIFQFAPPANGTYRLLVRDLYYGSRGDPRYVYRVSIRPATHDFHLAVLPVDPTDNNNQVSSYNPQLRPGGTCSYQILAFRQDGFDEAIELSVDGLPGSIQAAPAVIGKNQSQATLVLHAEDKAKDWAGTFSVKGTAEIDGKTVTRKARYGTIVWPYVQNRTMGQGRVSDNLALAVIESEPAPFRVEVGEGKVYEMSRAGKLEIPVKAIRHNGYQGDISLNPIDIPREMQVNKVTLKGKDTDGKLEVSFRSNMELGKRTLYLQAQAKYKYAKHETFHKLAQEELKLADEYLKTVTEEEKKAKEAAKQAQDQLNQSKQELDNARKALQAAQNELNKKKDDAGLKQKVTQAEQRVKQTEQKLKDAEAALKQAQEKAKQAEETVKQANTLKSNVDKEVKEYAKNAKPKDINLVEPATTVVLNITASPIRLPENLNAKLKPEGQLELPVEINKLYGFDDDVRLELKAPGGVRGISIQRLDLKKGQSQGKFEIKANKDATPGEHTFTLEANLRFNNQNLKVEQPVKIVIEKA